MHSTSKTAVGIAAYHSHQVLKMAYLLQPRQPQATCKREASFLFDKPLALSQTCSLMLFFSQVSLGGGSVRLMWYQAQCVFNDVSDRQTSA